MLEIGTKAPVFKLPNQDGVEIGIDEYKDKWTVLYFYPKDDTPGCTLEAQDFSSELDFFQNIGAFVVGISPDAFAKHKKFEQKYDLKLVLLSDENKEVLKQYDAWGLKKNYGKEYEGVTRSTYIISPQGDIAAIWKNVKVKGHVEAVKTKLEELKKA